MGKIKEKQEKVDKFAKYFVVGLLGLILLLVVFRKPVMWLIGFLFIVIFNIDLAI